MAVIFEKGAQLQVVLIEPLEGNSVAPPLKIGEVKELMEIHTCECGQQHFHVGLVSEYNYVRCHTCKVELPNSAFKHWCHPSRFIKAE